MSFANLDGKMGRAAQLWVSAYLLVATLSGCTGIVAPLAEPVTITFAHPSYEADYYTSLVREFNETYPHITIELVSPDGSEPADSFIASPFELEDLLEEGSILNLGPFIEQDGSFDLSDFYPNTVALFSHEGDTWAIPAEITMLTMFYNRDLFDAYGVPYPQVDWTWDDFLNKALVISDRDNGVYGYAPMASGGFYQILDPLAFVYLHGGQVLDDWQNPTRTTFDDPLAIEAMDWYGDLIHVHQVAPGPDDVYHEPFDGSLMGGVYRGKVAMWTSWLAERGGGEGLDDRWPAEWEVNWGVVPLPRDARATAPAFVQGYYISSETAHPQESWYWVSFLSQQVPIWMMPARRSLAESGAYEQQVGGEVAGTARASVEGAMLFSPRLFQLEQWFFPFFRALEAVTHGRTTALEAMTQAQQQTGQ